MHNNYKKQTTIYCADKQYSSQAVNDHNVTEYETFSIPC